MQSLLSHLVRAGTVPPEDGKTQAEVKTRQLRMKARARYVCVGALVVFCICSVMEFLRSLQRIIQMRGAEHEENGHRRTAHCLAKYMTLAELK